MKAGAASQVHGRGIILRQVTHHTHKPLEGRSAAVMIGPNFEDSEATYPFYRLQEAGPR